MSTRTYRNYTREFKIQAVAFGQTVGRTEAARQLEIPVNMLDNWIDPSRKGRSLSSPNRRPVSKNDSELARLRAENAELKLDREILKKAAVLFAKASR